MKITKSCICFSVLLYALILGMSVSFVGCSKGKKKDKKEEYTPSETFEPAYQKLQKEIKQKENKVSEYDIEETVRILNGMELAQSQSDDFAEFMEYMAKQDYSQVPKEVIEAKAELFPILDKLFKLQNEYEEMNTWQGVAKNMGNPLLEQSQEAYTADEDKKGKVSSGLNLFKKFLIVAAPFTGGGTLGAAAGIESIEVLGKFGDYAFDQYEKQEKLKGDKKKQIEEVRLEYANYLSKFTPLYVKYMKEWDRLCLKKDRAYINLYSGQPSEALNNVEEILDQYPNNREAMLLKALALMEMSRKYEEGAHKTLSFSPKEVSFDSTSQSYLLEAKVTIDQYIEKYPDYSAPALMLNGVWNLYQGNQPQAFTYFDQAAVEYPRQAEKLSDMLDSYRMRTYLTGSAEGTHLMQLYQSTMEGAGLFSPNLMKAMYYEHNGNIDASREEIYRHFFRRSNQGVYDCLTADMDFCEENLYSSFKQLLPEGSYVDVKFKRSKNWIGVKSKDSKPQIDVTVVNRADKDLVNLRIFLVLHFTDMYTTENYIVKLPTINRIAALDKVTLEDVPLRYYDKKFSDITRARAIAMTDNSICWVDNVINNEDHVDYNEAHQVDWMNLSSKLDPEKNKSMATYLKTIKQNNGTIVKSIEETSSLSIEERKDWKKKTEGYTLKVDFPRILSFFSPTFVLNKTDAPKQEIIKGSYVHLEFELPVNPSQQQVVYMVSDFMNLAVTINVAGSVAKIQKVEVIN